MPSSSVLIVGATRGLGEHLAKQYAERPNTTVYGTSRSSSPPDGFPSGVKWLTGIDLMDSEVGDKIVKGLGDAEPLSVVIITAGYFALEDFGSDKGPSWEAQQRMYTTSSIAPVFVIQRLHAAGRLQTSATGTAAAKIVLVSSESGSITLRHEKEGGGNYGHHASKTALNMVGKLLSLDLKGDGVVVSIVHPGFMRTEMTAGVGFDKYWDDGGAVTPDVAAKGLLEWTDKLDMPQTGEYWAPRGPGDIGTAEEVLGKGLETPLKLPW
ncbi:short chain dehydrogenase domain-containing protein [Sarocladium implicatum]|nr:short chain dehydrogenase domain-containing protein [Sarocladium implicatum]